MWQNVRRVTALFGFVCVASFVSAQADTSFTEPGDRPANSDMSIVLPEPALPVSSGATSDAAAPVASESDETGVVDGRSVGRIASPELSVPGSILELFDHGPTGLTGSRTDPLAADAADDGAAVAAVTNDVRLSPVRPPVITSDPPARPDLNVDARWPVAARAGGGVISHSQIIAYYGQPYSRFMGVLGEGAIDAVAEQLKKTAAEYDAINGDIGVVLAFHLIYGTVYEDASVGILRESKTLEYIEYAKQHDMLVFLDHQIGNGTVDAAIRAMLPFLRYDNVHLAIDPEWATDKPGKEIGSITAEEVNHAQQLISDYLSENDLPGPRMLVVHQFNYRMITDRERVRNDVPDVELIHDADGFGPPAHKRDTWRFNTLATNMPLKGFKLFYPKSWRNGGYDVPLMSPEEVMQLNPVPVYIQYQ